MSRLAVLDKTVSGVLLASAFKREGSARRFSGKRLMEEGIQKKDYAEHKRALYTRFIKKACSQVGDKEIGYKYAMACRKLARMQAKEAVPTLEKLIFAQNDELRWAAAEALGKMGAKELVPKLWAKLEVLEANESLQKSKLKGLGAAGLPKEALEMLSGEEINELIRIEPYSREWENAVDGIITALAELGEKKIAKKAAGYLRRKHSKYWKKSSSYWEEDDWEFGETRFNRRLRNEALKGDSLAIACIHVIRKLKAVEHAPMLLKEFKKLNQIEWRFTEKIELMRALRELRVKKAVQEIKKCITYEPSDKWGTYGVRLIDKIIWMKAEAISIAGEMDAKELVPEIKKFLFASNRRLGACAANALVKLMTGEEAEQLKEECKKRFSTKYKYGRLETRFMQLVGRVTILIRLDAREYLPEMIGLLSHEDEETRKLAAKAVGKWGGEKEAKELITWLAGIGISTNTEKKCGYILALAELNATEASFTLIKRYLVDEEKEVAQTAIGALRKFHSEEKAMKKLILLLGTADEELQKTAKSALDAVDDEKVVSVVIEWMQEKKGHPKGSNDAMLAERMLGYVREKLTREEALVITNMLVDAVRQEESEISKADAIHLLSEKSPLEYSEIARKALAECLNKERNKYVIGALISGLEIISKRALE
ncbi:MAG: HEAT repeat domain-containing protein [Candidatus Micrarchaeota archaeon]